MKYLKISGVIILVILVAVLVVRLFSGPEDTWLCQNGQWVKHGQPSAPKPTTDCGDTGQNNENQNNNSANENQEIIVTKPKANEVVGNPLIIEGQARGSWFFEAVFPVELVDAQGKTLAIAQAKAQSDWMTDNFVPFKAEINYQAEATTTGKLILKNDNPSGLKENDKQIEISVTISPTDSLTVKVFFSNNNLDPEITCQKVFSVERQVAKTEAIARAAIEELLKGASAEDRAGGYYTSINQGVKIQKLTIENGKAKVDFDKTMEEGMGGSCRVSAIRAQITETLKQFPTVKEVIISVDGRTEDVLQP
jgi:spore germination protein GerM